MKAMVVVILVIVIPFFVLGQQKRNYELYKLVKFKYDSSSSLYFQEGNLFMEKWNRDSLSHITQYDLESFNIKRFRNIKSKYTTDFFNTYKLFTDTADGTNFSDFLIGNFYEDINGNLFAGYSVCVKGIIIKAGNKKFSISGCTNPYKFPFIYILKKKDT